MKKPTYEELLTIAKNLLWRIQFAGLDAPEDCQCGKPRPDFVCLLCDAKDVIKRAEGAL